MFNSPQPNIIESSDGFCVEVLGRAGFLYREGDRKMVVNSEILTGPSGMVIYHKSIVRWDAPHNSQLIETPERARILANIREAFRFQGFEPQII
jgi:hypothetical protein